MDKHIKAQLSRWFQRNGLWIFFLTVLMVASFFVGQAFASEPEHETKWLAQKGEQYIIARPATTTTTAPKIEQPIPVGGQPPSSVAVENNLIAKNSSVPQGDWVAICHGYAAQAGIVLSDDAIVLIGRESKCDVNATNPSSGACSIPQALPCSKLGDARYDPVRALQWMDNYVNVRYGGWTQARQHSDAKGWY